MGEGRGARVFYHIRYGLHDRRQPQQQSQDDLRSRPGLTEGPQGFARDKRMRACVRRGGTSCTPQTLQYSPLRSCANDGQQNKRKGLRYQSTGRHRGLLLQMNGVYMSCRGGGGSPSAKIEHNMPNRTMYDSSIRIWQYSRAHYFFEGRELQGAASRHWETNASA